MEGTKHSRRQLGIHENNKKICVRRKTIFTPYASVGQFYAGIFGGNEKDVLIL